MATSEETRRRRSESMRRAWAEGRVQRRSYKGKDNPFYGRKHRNSSRKKIAETRVDKQIGFGENNPFHGRKHSEKSRRQMSESLKRNSTIIGGVRKGATHTEKAKRRLSEVAKRRFAVEPHPMLGHVHSEQAKLAMSNGKKGKYCGPENSNWRGGTSSKPYPFGWNNKLRSFIKKRDGNSCKLAFERPDENHGGKLHVHHIDYNKDNLDHDNLITLCAGCHLRTNGNREYWERYLKSLLIRKD